MLKKAYLIATLLTLLYQNTFSQKIVNYTVTGFANNFTAIAGTQPALSFGNADEGAFNTIPIGFDFFIWASGIPLYRPVPMDGFR